MIILLDLNYTLVENSTEKLNPFVRQIANERYSKKLVAFLKDHTVLLVTARPAKYQAATLESIKEKTGWQPHDAIFNEWNLAPAQCKERALKTRIFPGYGNEAGNYIAIESNPRTRAMYARYSIASVNAESALQHETIEDLARDIRAAI